MTKKKAVVSKPKSKAVVVKSPVKKIKNKPEEKLENLPVDQAVIPQDVMLESPVDEKPTVLEDVPSVREPKGRKSKELVVTPEMEKAIDEAKESIEAEMNKAEVARLVFGRLKGHERKQIVHVFMVGCGLTKAGAGTYYQNCKK